MSVSAVILPARVGVIDTTTDGCPLHASMIASIPSHAFCVLSRSTWPTPTRHRYSSSPKGCRHGTTSTWRWSVGQPDAILHHVGPQSLPQPVDTVPTVPVGVLPGLTMSRLEQRWTKQRVIWVGCSHGEIWLMKLVRSEEDEFESLSGKRLYFRCSVLVSLFHETWGVFYVAQGQLAEVCTLC
jgi:hypothetical protein